MRSTSIVGLACLVLVTAGCAKEDSALPLPTFKPCSSASHPTLPEKWQAVALLQDFFHDSLVFGRFVYDEGAAAFRFTLADRYGFQLDLMATEDKRLFLLFGEGEMPSSCALVSTDTQFTVPTRDWLGEASCVGEAPILTRNQEWWKTSDPPGANWIWYNTTDRIPFRTMYYAAPTGSAPIYEFFTFSYYPVFESVPKTNLADIVQLCNQSDATMDVPELDFDDFRALLKSHHYPEQNPDTIELAQQWIPGLSECSSTGSLPPEWPNQVEGTVFMTAVNYKVNPFPTRVYYDWTQIAQNTSLYDSASPGASSNVALLTGDTGYIFERQSDGRVSNCQQVLPGPQIPNWQRIDGCECRAELAPYSVLNPTGTTTKILWCPTDLSADQVFWTWYSDKGTPVVFMQSNSSPTAGTGLNLADYYTWSPGSIAPAGTFSLPSECDGQPKIPVPEACHNCHLPNPTR